MDYLTSWIPSWVSWVLPTATITTVVVLIVLAIFAPGVLKGVGELVRPILTVLGRIGGELLSAVWTRLKDLAAVMWDWLKVGWADIIDNRATVFTVIVFTSTAFFWGWSTGKVPQKSYENVPNTCQAVITDLHKRYRFIPK